MGRSGCTWKDKINVFWKFVFSPQAFSGLLPMKFFQKTLIKTVQNVVTEGVPVPRISQKMGFSSFFLPKFDDVSKFSQRLMCTPPLWNIIKYYGQKLAKNEEKPCSNCSRSPFFHVTGGTRNPGFARTGTRSATTKLHFFFCGFQLTVQLNFMHSNEDVNQVNQVKPI